MDPYASAKASLVNLIASVEPKTDLNEATTRLRLIDGLIMDCLGWPLAEVDAETYHDGDYVDYALGKPATDLILEAKREGITFGLPAGIAGRQSVDLSTLCEDTNTAAAIKQVLSYCQTRGVPVAVISNGHQLVAFYASRQDGVPPLEGRALVFSSLQEMLDNFKVLWANLSREGVAGKSLQRLLFGKHFKAMAAEKLSDSIGNYPGFRARSALETDLKMLGGLFIQDLESEESVSDDFLRECYCSSGALSQYALVSKEILRARYTAIDQAANVQTEPVRLKKGLNPSLTADVMTAALSRRPLILLGDVGVGKTMFLRHLISIEAADAIKNSLVFYVNFGTEPALETNLEEYVYRRMTSQLLDGYETDIHEASFVRAVYNAELNRFRRSIYGYLEKEDPTEFRRQELLELSRLTTAHSSHLKRSLEHIRGTSGRGSVVVLDNIDQRPHDFQDRAFLIAQSLADSWPATVFVALRPQTFYESKNKGSLAAYQLRVFTVEPTRVDDVVSKRLNFARKQLVDASANGTFPQNLSLSGDDLQAYMDVLIKAFNENEKLKELLDNLSGGNLRLALTYLSAFVGSGYVSTQRVLEEAKRGRVYTVPIHEFLRSIIFGEYEYYDPAASEICNLFDVTNDDGREHFLLPMILAYLQRAGEQAGGDGFVEAGTVHAVAQTWGFLQEQVGFHLRRAIEKRLLEPSPGKGVGGPFRITSVGSYMYKYMVRNFVYVDAMVVDTPIGDLSVRRTVKAARAIADRLLRAEILVTYLDEQWNKLELDQNEAFDWIDVSHALRTDIDRVRTRAENALYRS